MKKVLLICTVAFSSIFTSCSTGGNQETLAATDSTGVSLDTVAVVITDTTAVSDSVIVVDTTTITQ